MRSLKICALAALFSTPLAAEAAHPVVDDVDDRIVRADAVIQGEVQRVRFVESQPDGDQPGVPHTLVTYRVERVFKGRVAGDTVTLRFFGGLDASGDELVMTSNGTQYDPGDRDIVMLAGNGVAECPIVDCTFGRFRLVDGAAYDDAGRAMVLDAAGGLRRGSAHALHAVDVWETVGLVRVRDAEDDAVLAEVHEAPADALAGPVAPVMIRKRIDKSSPLLAATFAELIAERARLLSDPGAPPTVLRDVDPDAPFVYRQPEAVAPIEPADTPPAGAAGPR